jgi:hypothetical protein
MANTSFTDLLGSLLGTGMSPTGTDRLKEALGGGGPASGTDVPNLLKSLGLDTSKLGDILGGTGKIGDILGGLFGGQKGEGIGQTLSGTLEEAQKALGENKNLALAALGALAGAILGGGSRSMKGAVGGGVLAVLGALAYQALKGIPAGDPGSALNAQRAGNPGRKSPTGESGPIDAESHDQRGQGRRSDRPGRSPAHHR